MKKTRGFTVVEVMVAILIFAVWLIGAFVLANTAISLSIRSKQEIIATNIIREQIELVKNIRDSNWLALRDWKDISLPANCEHACAFETGAWYRIENDFTSMNHPIFIEKLSFPLDDQNIRKQKILEIAKGSAPSSLRLCVDEKWRYQNCTHGGISTPYYAFFSVSSVKTKDASGNFFEVPGIFEITGYMTTTEGGYREFNFSTLISDWKK